jgi:hypothetical protein
VINKNSYNNKKINDGEKGQQDEFTVNCSQHFETRNTSLLLQRLMLL